MDQPLSEHDKLIGERHLAAAESALKKAAAKHRVEDSAASLRLVMREAFLINIYQSMLGTPLTALEQLRELLPQKTSPSTGRSTQA